MLQYQVEVVFFFPHLNSSKTTGRRASILQLRFTYRNFFKALWHFHASHKTYIASYLYYFYLNNAQRYKRDFFGGSRACVMRVNGYVIRGRLPGNVSDKPYEERLVELCVYTVPIFCHSLVFFQKYSWKVFKEFSKTCYKSASHYCLITAVYLSLGRTWKPHLYSLYMCCKHGYYMGQQAAERSLRIILSVYPKICCVLFQKKGIF